VVSGRRLLRRSTAPGPEQPVDGTVTDPRDRNDNIIAGNKTIARRAGCKRVIVVPSNGTTLVAVRCAALDINSKKTSEPAIADNRVGAGNKP
jgi:hypothetical protein